MVCPVDERIVNIVNFRKDISPRFSRGNVQKVIIDLPATEHIKEITVKDFESLMREVLKLSKSMPHSKCALTYKINEQSSICLEIHPVTDAA